MGGFNVGAILNDLRKFDSAKNKWLKRKGVPKPVRALLGGINTLSYELESEEEEYGRNQDFRGSEGSYGKSGKYSRYNRGKKYKSYGGYGNYGKSDKRSYNKYKSYQGKHKKAYSGYGQNYNSRAYGTKRYGRRRY